jgi:hypothetical protein
MLNYIHQLYYTFLNRDDFITCEFNELGLGVSIATRIY